MAAPLCACGVPSQGFMSITEANPFRRFAKCNSDKTCGLMIWIDKELDEYYKSLFFEYMRNEEILGKEIDDLTTYASYLQGLLIETQSDEDKYSMGVESDPDEIEKDMHENEEYENNMAYTPPEDICTRGRATASQSDESNGVNHAKKFQSDKVFIISYGIIVALAFVLYLFSK